jgi:hypothetical protein
VLALEVGERGGITQIAQRRGGVDARLAQYARPAPFRRRHTGEDQLIRGTQTEQLDELGHRIGGRPVLLEYFPEGGQPRECGVQGAKAVRRRWILGPAWVVEAVLKGENLVWRERKRVRTVADPPDRVSQCPPPANARAAAITR